MFSDTSFSSKRRRISVGIRAKFSIVAAVPLVAFALQGGACFESPTFAQSIINGSSETGNRFEGFSTRSPEKIAWLDAASDAASTSPRLDLAPPTRAAKEIAGSRIPIPFRFREGGDRDASDAIELFYSDDSGATWRSFEKIGAADGKTTFLFDAPRSGEYWLALKTYFKDGRSAFSETRAFRFSEGVESFGASALPLPASNSEPPTGLSFALNDDLDAADSAADSAAPKNAGGAASGGDYSTRLLALARGEDAEERRPTPASAEEPAAPEPPTVDESQVVPHPGKIKSISVAKDKETNELLFVARWFRPDELEEKYRGKPTTVALERADSPAGPWTTIADGLKSEDFGYWWAPDPEDLKPFYLRSVSTDSEGNVWVDPLANPVDVSAQGVRSALGKTKTPIPPAPPKTDADSDADGAKTVASKRSKTGANADAEISLIRNTASEDEEAGEESDASDDDATRADSAKKSSSLKAGKRRTAASETADAETSRRTTVAAPRPRPNIPAPTNPNEFQLNPLFTRGLGVVFQATQTRAGDGSTGGKRSIFTPPSRAAAVAATPPAEYRSVAAARRREEAQAKDMSSYEKQPELMEGMVFYQDENGNLSKTPPADFQTAGVDFGAANGSFAGGGAAQQMGTAADGSPLFLPSDNEAYDAAANSGAATLTNAMYPNAATPGNSPINERYSNGAAPGPVPTTGAPTNALPPSGDGANYRAIPQTSFGRSVSSAPTGNYPVGGAYSNEPRAATRSVFPPRPNVAN